MKHTNDEELDGFFIVQQEPILERLMTHLDFVTLFQLYATSKTSRQKIEAANRTFPVHSICVSSAATYRAIFRPLTHYRNTLLLSLKSTVKSLYIDKTKDFGRYLHFSADQLPNLTLLVIYVDTLDYRACMTLFKRRLMENRDVVAYFRHPYEDVHLFRHMRALPSSLKSIHDPDAHLFNALKGSVALQ